MRNGDLYKIQALAKNGHSTKDIVEAFKNSYSEEEIKRFIPKPAPKKKTAKKDPLG